jgi:hypothetical protein
MSGKTKTCPYCGAEIKSSDTTCPKCGRVILISIEQSVPEGFVTGPTGPVLSGQFIAADTEWSVPDWDSEVEELRLQVQELREAIVEQSEHKTDDMQKELQDHIESLSGKLDGLGKSESPLRGVVLVEDISVSLVQAEKVDRFSFLDRWAGFFLGLSTLFLGAFISSIAAPSRPQSSMPLGLTQAEWVELIIAVILGVVTVVFYILTSQAEKAYKETTQATPFALTLNRVPKQQWPSEQT